jgi:hypothetical protein
MDVIKISVQAYMLDLMPEHIGRLSERPKPQTPSSVLQLTALANGLALPSFWTEDEIKQAFEGANKVWDQAKIQFAPVTISSRTEAPPADEDGMWRHFVNRLSPHSGIAVAFVYDLPSDEGGWGGGKIAAISGAKATGAIEGFEGRILAHEMGHILLNTPEHRTTPSNLMYGSRHPRVVTADLLDGTQIDKARSIANAL